MDKLKVEEVVIKLVPVTDVLRGCPKLNLAVALTLTLVLILALTLTLVLILALVLALALAMNDQLKTSFKELRTYFNELWTSSGILGQV